MIRLWHLDFKAYKAELFILIGMFLVNSAQCFSTNIAKFSITVLQPVVRSLAETIGLCILC